jgi:hypothetical protein
MKAGRNSISVELDPTYFQYGVTRVDYEADIMGGLFATRPSILVDPYPANRSV